MLWSCIHEGGHALYEQGLPDSEYGPASGDDLVGLHEARPIVGGIIGRSLPFWEWKFARLKNFSQLNSGRFCFGFLKAMNKGFSPSLIRMRNADRLFTIPYSHSI